MHTQDHRKIIEDEKKRLFPYFVIAILFFCVGLAYMAYMVLRRSRKIIRDRKNKENTLIFRQV